MPLPTSYDTYTSVFGDLQDNIVLTVANSGGINNSTTSITFSPTAKVDALVVPCYLTFLDEGTNGAFEIVKVTSKGTAGSGIVTVQRGSLSSTALAHAQGAQAVQDPVSDYLATLRTMLDAVQKYQGLVGTSLPATCSAGECYIKTDTQEVYYAVATNTWRLLNRKDHGTFTGLSDDDHTQYHNATRKTTWHTNLASTEGVHLTAAAHSHSGSGTDGAPAARILSGLFSARPSSPSSNGQVYFCTDTADLYVGNAGSWVKYSIMPQGTIILFETSCPSGWTRVSDFDGKLPRGAPASTWSGFTDGGVATHKHTLPDVVSHTHTISSQAASTGSDGAHSHSFNKYGGTGSSDVLTVGIFASTSSLLSESAGEHSHTVTIPAHNTDAAGSSAAETATETSYPPYIKLVFCKKN